LKEDGVQAELAVIFHDTMFWRVTAMVLSPSNEGHVRPIQVHSGKRIHRIMEPYETQQNVLLVRLPNQSDPPNRRDFILVWPHDDRRPERCCRNIHLYNGGTEYSMLGSLPCSQFVHKCFMKFKTPIQSWLRQC
jgi:hypothetical protein